MKLFYSPSYYFFTLSLACLLFKLLNNLINKCPSIFLYKYLYANICLCIMNVYNIYNEYITFISYNSFHPLRENYVQSLECRDQEQ